MKRLLSILSVCLLFLFFSFSNRHFAPAKQPPELLSAFGFFDGKIADQLAATGVLPYTLQTPLFSNYAEKARFIKLPEGKTAGYKDQDVFDLPVGTYLVKTFYYPLDFRDPQKGKRIMETRVMYHDESGWQTWPYIWKEDQSDAYYDPTGEKLQVSYINAQGKKVNTSYLVPNKNQCKGCHLQKNEVMPIGIAARHLANSPAIDVPEKMNQLQHWAQAGVLTGLPETGIKSNANWLDETQPLDARARAYLDINCGHCHRPDGPANTSGLFLHAQETNPTALGVFKTPVAAGRGSGNRQYDIVPGKPDASIIVYRMQTNDPGIAMPELGREQLHAEGIALIKEWIKKMK